MDDPQFREFAEALCRVLKTHDVCISDAHVFLLPGDDLLTRVCADGESVRGYTRDHQVREYSATENEPFMRRAVFGGPDAAKQALWNDEVDIAVIESGNVGKTFFYLLGDKEVPDVLRQLPGFEPMGTSGAPAPMVVHYVCYRTTKELLEKIP